MHYWKPLISRAVTITVLGLLWIGTTIAATPPKRPPGKVLERIVAVVNGDPILMSDLAEAKELFRKEMKPEKNDAEFAKKVLDQLINEKLIAQEIERQGLVADNAAIDRAVEGVMAQNGFRAISDLERALRLEGMSLAEYRLNIKKQMETSRLINNFIRPKVAITEQDVDEAIHRAGATTKMGWKMDIGMIFKAKPKGTRKEINQLRKQLKAGIPFTTIAARETEGPAKSEGGRIGWVSPTDLQPELQKALDKMKPGEFSSVIETKQGYYLLHLIDKKEAPIQQSGKLQPEKIRQELEKKEIDRHFEFFVRNLRDKAHVEIKL